MSTLTIAQYRAVTGDVDTPNTLASARIEEAEAMVEEYLGRTLSYGEQTETLRVGRLGMVYPTRTPVASIPADVSYEIYDTWTIWNAETDPEPWTGWTWWNQETDAAAVVVPSYPGPYAARAPGATVTYTGGYQEGQLPRGLRRYIALLAYALRAPAVASAIPAGATSVSLGDASVSFGDGFAQGDEMESLVPGITNALRPYMHPGKR